MNDTVFGKIIRGELPSTKIYEDAQCLAFLNIHPTTKGHTLLIPKEQYRWMHDAPNEIIATIFIKTKELMKGLLQGLPCDLVQIVVAGEEVEHFHIHLIPRMHGERLDNIAPGSSYTTNEEMVAFAEKISSGLQQKRPG